MVAEVVDAVIGIDTHRDSHEVEIADPRGTPIAMMGDQQRQRRIHPSCWPRSPSYYQDGE